MVMLELFLRTAWCFNVDIMMLYISAMDHARRLELNVYVHLLSINKCFNIVTLE